MNPAAGGGNEEITGCVRDSLGAPTGPTQVTLRKIDQWQMADTTVQNTTQTDNSGGFRFGLNDTGTYTIEYNHGNHLGKLRKITLHEGERIQISDTVRPYCLLAGTIDTVLVEAHDSIMVYAVEIKKIVRAVNGAFIFPRLPSGDYSLKVFANDSVISSPRDTAPVTLKAGDSVYVNAVGSASGTRIDSLLPGIPVGLIGAALSPTSIKISWNRVASALEYEVSKMQAHASFAAICTTAACQFTDSQVAPGTTCSYRVAAINGIGRSGLTEAISVTTPLTNPGGINILLDSSFLGQNSAVARVTARELSDGGSIVAAGTSLVRLAANSAVLWTAKLGCIARRMYLTSEKGLLVMGYCIGYDKGFVYLPRIVKTDSAGVEMWRSDFSRPAQSLFTGENGFCLTGDGGCAFISTTIPNGGGTAQTYIGRVNAAGNILMGKLLGDSVTSSEGMAILQTSDLGFIMAANTSFLKNPAGSGRAFCNVLKLNASGDTVWTKSVGKSKNAELFLALQTGNGLVVAGRSGSPGSSAYDSSYLAMLDLQGTVLWEKNSPDADLLREACQTRDGGFAFAGGSSDSNAVLVKTNGSGDRLWRRVYSGKLNGAVYSVQQTSDGGFIMAGQYFMGYGGYPRVIKTDPQGISSDPPVLP